MENTDNFDMELPWEELSSDTAMNTEPPEDQPQTLPRRSRSAAAKKDDDWQKSMLLYLHDLVCLAATLIVITLLIVRVVVVSGTSMTNTLMNGDYLLVLSNTFYKEPKQGDIIVASKDSFDNGAPIVKRVIATEGQTVDIDFQAGIVYVDGVALNEPYTRTATNIQEGVTFPLTVDEGCIFVLGDNRNGSRDSRYPGIGQINKQEVLGKVFFLFLPGSSEETNTRDFGRIGVISGWNRTE